MVCRVKYDETLRDLKAAVAKKTGVPAESQQLFWHQKELTSSYDDKTLLDMHLHTGLSLRGYDLVCLLRDCVQSFAFINASEISIRCGPLPVHSTAIAQGISTLMQSRWLGLASSLSVYR